MPQFTMIDLIVLAAMAVVFEIKRRFMKHIVIIAMLIGGCVAFKPKVKEEVKGLQNLKTECDNLQLELETLGAKKWTKIIDTKVKQCKDHGFWSKPKRRINTYTEGLE